ncbi:GDSL esterase/lipase At4g01130-like [Apium graveolens]|uniref:GDSL esterase/lipase At4g01130-like n=1 Tax=Apium graveolens TaxID=4045 RepID=UPI003D7B251C
MSSTTFQQYVCVVLMLIITVFVRYNDANCTFQAIFNFGDSNSDTGSMPMSSPNGNTYFQKPAGRSCDGRLMIDFLAQALGFPFLNAYSESGGSDYTHGVNFAAQGATVKPPDSSNKDWVSPYYLAIQLNRMKTYASKVSQDVLGKSIYTIHIGQNDVTGVLGSAGVGGVKQNLPQVANDIVSTVKELYGLGGRTFMVLNTGPMGCYPAFLVQWQHSNSDVDKAGCMTSYNGGVSEFNQMLKDALFGAKQQLPDANLVYVDIYSALLDIFQNPSSHGLKHGTTTCCGAGGSYNFNPQIMCGHSGTINGSSVTASACEDPYDYISWDGVHTTEAANKIVMNSIVNGYYTQPTFDLHKYCDIQPIG